MFAVCDVCDVCIDVCCLMYSGRRVSIPQCKFLLLPPALMGDAGSSLKLTWRRVVKVDNGGIMFLWCDGTLLTDFMTSHSRRQRCENLTYQFICIVCGVWNVVNRRTGALYRKTRRPVYKVELNQAVARCYLLWRSVQVKCWCVEMFRWSVELHGGWISWLRVSCVSYGQTQPTPELL
jgi:hypothetical protein